MQPVKPLPTAIKKKEPHWSEEPCVSSTRLKKRTSEDLEGDKPSPAPDKDLESNWTFQVRPVVANLCA